MRRARIGKIVFLASLCMGLAATPVFAQLQSGDIIAADDGANTLWRVTPGGVVTAYATGLSNGPFSVAVDSLGNVIVGNNNGLIQRVDSSGVVTDIGNAGSTLIGGIAVESSGDYVISSFNGNIYRMTPAGALSTVVAVGGTTWGIGLDANGDYIVSQQPNNILRVTPAGVVTTIASVPGLSFIQGLTVGSDGNYYAGAELPSAVYKITPGGTVTTLHSGAPYSDPGEGLAYSNDLLYVPDDSAGPAIFIQDPAGGAPTVFVSGAPFQGMSGITISGSVTPSAAVGVPTLSVWALTALVAMFILLGVRARRRV